MSVLNTLAQKYSVIAAYEIAAKKTYTGTVRWVLPDRERGLLVLDGEGWYGETEVAFSTELDNAKQLKKGDKVEVEIEGGRATNFVVQKIKKIKQK